jgi:hypothetical protein
MIRRLVTFFLICSMFLLPVVASCVPGGYEGQNPGRPAENQVDVEGLQPEGEAPADESGAAAPADEGTTEAPSADDTAGG